MRETLTQLFKAIDIFFLQIDCKFHLLDLYSHLCYQGILKYLFKPHQLIEGFLFHEEGPSLGFDDTSSTILTSEKVHEKMYFFCLKIRSL